MRDPIDPRDMRKLFKKMDELIELNLKQIETMRELKRCYRLANLLGMHPKDMKGQVRTHYVDNRTSFRKYKDCEFHVRVDNVTHVYDLLNVPAELWPPDIRKSFERDYKDHIANRKKIPAFKYAKKTRKIYHD